MKPVAKNTDLRAALASATVKKRIRICGSPAVPKISARPSEIAEIGLDDEAPGAMMATCFGWTSTASANSASGLKPNFHNTASAMKVAPDSSRHGLDDLHPGGGEHAAEGDVDDHQHADDDHRHPVVEAEQDLDQLAGADHLARSDRTTTVTSEPQAARMRIGVWPRRNEATSAKVYLPRLRSGSAIRKVTIGQPTRKPTE